MLLLCDDWLCWSYKLHPAVDLAASNTNVITPANPNTIIKRNARFVPMLRHTQLLQLIERGTPRAWSVAMLEWSSQVRDKSRESNPRIQLGSRKVSAMFSKTVPTFCAFRAIEITTDFLFVGMATSPMHVLFKPFDGS